MPTVSVSLGGWCGPALVLGRLGVRHAAYPFDFSRCTLDGVLHFVEHGFDGSFFPAGPPYAAECVGPYVLFRGPHTAFAHFDLNSAEVQRGFERKMRRFDQLLDGGGGDGGVVTFFRTITASDPAEELSIATRLEAAIARRRGRRPFRLVFIVHDQGLACPVVELAPLSPNIRIWTLEYAEDVAAGNEIRAESLLDRTMAGYTAIMTQALQESGWPASPPQTPLNVDPAHFDAVHQCWLPRSPRRTEPVPHQLLRATTFPWRHHNNLALIDGIASVGGTCRGVGSTRLRRPRGCPYLQPSVCAYCGDTNLHAVRRQDVRARKAADHLRPFQSHEDAVLLAHLCRMAADAADKVAAVDQLTQELRRDASEIVARLQHLACRHPALSGGATPSPFCLETSVADESRPGSGGGREQPFGEELGPLSGHGKDIEKHRSRHDTKESPSPL